MQDHFACAAFKKAFKEPMITSPITAISSAAKDTGNYLKTESGRMVEIPHLPPTESSGSDIRDKWITHMPHLRISQECISYDPYQPKSFSLLP